MTTSRAKTVVGLVALVLGSAGACSNRVAHSSSETNWFDTCETDAECSVGHCVCGVCTESCDEDTNCPGVYTCAGSGSGAFSRLCAGATAAPHGVCLPGCGGGSACTAGFECEGDACVPKARMASGNGGIGAGRDGGSRTEQALSNSFFIDQIQTGSASDGLIGKCLPRALSVDAEGLAPCEILKFSNDAACRCDAPGVRMPTAGAIAAAKSRLREIGACDTAGQPSCDAYCGCELIQESGGALQACQQQDVPLTDGSGWCYVDPDAGVGNPALVAGCPATQRHILRLAGTPNELFTIACTVTTAVTPHDVGQPGAIGDPCTPQDEFRPKFSGYSEREVNIESQSPSCSTGVCLVANFRGRTTCTYGQPASGMTVDGVPTVAAGLGPDERCYFPGASHEPANEVKVPVEPQLIARSPEKSVYCSCRCDGPAGQGPFCACPSGFECTPLVDYYGTATGAEVSGSYCLKTGTQVPDPTKIDQTECNRRFMGPRPQGCEDP